MNRRTQDTLSTQQPLKLLVIGSDKTTQAFLQSSLENEGFQLCFVANCNEARQRIFQSSAPSYSAYLFDDLNNNSENLALLKALKADSKYAIVPAIFQTDAQHYPQIQQGLENGAYFYLLKPYTRPLLLSVLNAAIKGVANHHDISRQLNEIKTARSLLKKALFHIKTIDDAKSLSSVLAYTAPAPQNTAVGLFELMINAIEHGTLQMTYEEKTRLIKQDKLQQEIQRRLALPEHKNKVVEVLFERTDTQLQFTVRDSGEGFHYSPFLEFSIERAMHSHGRGIMIANKLSFDELIYQNNGSTVIARIHLNDPQNEG